MQSEKLQDWLQIVGMAAIVASLVFVGLQLRQSEHAALADLSQSSVANGIEFSSLAADYSEIWLKACAGDELSQPEQFIANSIFFRYFQDNFNSWARNSETEIGSMPSAFFTDAFAANIHRYPGFGKMALSWNEWAERGVPSTEKALAHGYREDVLQRLGELAKEEPDRNSDITWCGVR